MNPEESERLREAVRKDLEKTNAFTYFKNKGYEIQVGQPKHTIKGDIIEVPLMFKHFDFIYHVGSYLLKDGEVKVPMPYQLVDLAVNEAKKNYLTDKISRSHLKMLEGIINTPVKWGYTSGAEFMRKAKIGKASLDDVVRYIDTVHKLVGQELSILFVSFDADQHFRFDLLADISEVYGPAIHEEPHGRLEQLLKLRDLNREYRSILEEDLSDEYMASKHDNLVMGIHNQVLEIRGQKGSELPL